MRRTFIKTILTGMAGTIVSAEVYSHAMEQNKPQINAALVREFVDKSHGDFGRVKELLDKEPALIHAVWDWGGGDFESGLGAAAHMGRVDIAEFLLAKGARIDLFCGAMLGLSDMVKASLVAYPFLKTSKGPHGLTLMYHARQGGERAKDVVAFLESVKAS